MSKKITILLLFFTFYSFHALAQKQNVIDSLSQLLTYAKTDTTKVNILSDLAFCYVSYDINKAMQHAATSLQLAQSIKYPYGIALSLRNISYIYYVKSEYSLALKYALESLNEAQKINNLALVANNFGVIGNIYLDQKEDQKALAYYQKALEAALLAKDNQAITTAYNRLGRAYIKGGNYTQAVSMLNESTAIAKQLGSIEKESDCLFYLGKAYYMQKEYKKALSYFYRCLSLDQKTEDKISIAMTFKEIAKIHHITKQLDSAITYSKYALASVQTINPKQEIQEIYEIIYLTYKEKKDLKNALYYHEQMMILKDSIYSKDKINAIVSLQKSYDIKEKEIQIEKQDIIIQLNQKKINEERIIRNVFTVGLVATTLLGFVFYYNYQKIQKINNVANLRNKIIQEQTQNLQVINEELNQQNEQINAINENLGKIVDERTTELKHTIENLSKQNQDLEQFSYIISHNLRAPVARILGLMNVLDKSEIVSPNNQKVIDYLEKSTQNLDEVIKDLTQIISIRKNLTSNKELVNLKTELDTVLSYFTEQIKQNHIRIDYNFEEKYINSIKSYVHSIAFNLISNAIKYKSNKRALIINVKSEIVDNFVCLSIKDNGIGVNLTNVDTYKIFGLYQRMHDHVEGKGLGLYLVKTQIEFLNGKVSIDSKLDVGTTFKVYFPK
jgi:signal transduction histidine kinase